MDINSLRIFLAVAETGSFTGGARSLFMAQSNVSTSIQKLEREIGVALFTRTRNGVQLTDEGSELQNRARKILDQIEELRSLGDRNRRPSGRLRIASMESTAVVRLADGIRRFTALYPDIQIQLVTCDTSEQIRKLKTGEVDFAFPAESVEDGVMESRFLFEERLCLAGSSSRTKEHPESYLVLSSGCSFRRRLEYLLSQKKGDTSIFHEMSGIHTLLASVLAGTGKSIFPRSFLEYHGVEKRGLKIQEIKGKTGRLEFFSAWRKADQRRPVLLAWKDFLFEEFQGNGMD